MAETILIRSRLAAAQERETSHVNVVATDGRARATWDLPDSARLDPNQRTELIMEISQDGVTWQRMCSAITWGSPLMDLSTPSWFETDAPPAGWRLRGRLKALTRQMDCGCRVETITGQRTREILPLHHSVAYESAVAIVTGNSVGSLTTSSWTIGGTNRYCYAAVMWRQTGITCSSVSGAGGSFTAVNARVTNAAGRSVHLFGRIAPSTGSQTVTANFSDTWGNDLALKCVNYEGVDQTTPASDFNSANGLSTAATVTIANAATGDMIVDACVGNSTGTGTEGANQTERADGSQGANNFYVSDQAGADGGVMSWTLEFSGDWLTAGFRINQASAGGLSIPVAMNQLRTQGIS